jgi:hypothetical protein
MKPHLEEDFKNQQALLFALTDERRGVANGSPAAIELDKEIGGCQAYIRAYQLLKCYDPKQ